jgi:hypothetical protein
LGLDQSWPRRALARAGCIVVNATVGKKEEKKMINKKW